MKHMRSTRIFAAALILVIGMSLGATAQANGPHQDVTPHSDPMYLCFHNGDMYFMVVNGICPEFPFDEEEEEENDEEEEYHYTHTHNEVDCIISRKMGFQR